MNRRNRKGFTLAELLIVVAIIAVLVAISIPIFTSQMTKAKIAVDQSNVRSAKAAAAAEYMTNDESGDVKYIYDGSKVIKLGDNSSSNTSYMTADLRNLLSKDGYGKADGKDNKNSETGASGSPKGGYVEVTIDGDNNNNEIRAVWVSSFSMSGAVSASSLEDQIKKQGLSKADVIVFKADKNTTLDSDKTGKNSLADMFKGYENLKIIDLSNATLGKGDVYLFRDLPKSVEEIVLPNVGSSYNIVGVWYDQNGCQLGEQKHTPEINDPGQGSSRVEYGTFKAGDTIYKYPPATCNK